MKKIITLSIVCMVSGQLFAQTSAVSTSTKVQATTVKKVEPAKVVSATPAIKPITPATAEAVSIAPLTQAEITGTVVDAAKVTSAKAAAIKSKEEAQKAANVAAEKKQKDN